MNIFNSRTRENIGSILTMLMILMSIMIPVFVLDSFSIVVMVGLLLFCLLGFAVLDIKKIRNRRYKLRYLIPLLIFGASFLVHGLYFRVLGYIAIGVVFCIILPVMQKILAASNPPTMGHSISKGVMFCFIAFYVLSVLFGPPLGKDQYFSFLANPNIIGGIASITVAAVLHVLLCNKGKNTKLIWLYFFVLGLAISMCFFSNSRTNMLAILMQIGIVSLIEFVWLAKNFTKELAITYFKKIVVIILILILSFAFFFCSLTYVKQVISPFTFENIAFKDSLEISGDRFGKGLEGMDAFAFTSGRTAIWSDYIKNISLIGHSSESRDIDTGTRVMNDTNAHNVYLQVAYSAGLMAGIAVFAYIAIMGLELLAKVLKYIFKSETLSNDTIFLITAYFAFGIASITSAGYMMFTYLPATLFWILTYVVSLKEEK